MLLRRLTSSTSCVLFGHAVWVSARVEERATRMATTTERRRSHRFLPGSLDVA